MGRFPFLGDTLAVGFPFLGDTLAVGFPFLGDTLAVGFPFLGDTLAVGFPFLGDTLAWASLRGGKALGVTKPAFPPRAPPFPGTSLFCAVVWGSVLVNACMLLYWWRQAEPIFLFRRTEGGLRSRPVPGGCCIAGANLLLACCIAGADLLLPVAVLLVLTCSCLSLYCWC